MRTSRFVFAWWVVYSTSALLASASPLQNGGFEAGGDPPLGWTANGNVTVVPDKSGNHVAVLQEADSNGLSRIFQVFDITGQQTELSFRFKFIHGQPPSPAGPVPPDSFTAFLLDADGNRLLDQADEPSFTKGLLYQDSNGVSASSSYVSVKGPDQDGVCTATLDLSALTAGASGARLEFGLASAVNGVTSLVLLDGVATGCEPRVTCPDLDIVFIMDTSPSMNDEAEALCDGIPAIIADIQAALAGNDPPVSVFTTILGITEDGNINDGDGDGDPFDDPQDCPTECDPDFGCLLSDVLDEFGAAVPGNNGACPASLIDTGHNDVSESENWASATAIAAQHFTWGPGRIRLIIPISDEGPCMGGSDVINACNLADQDAIDNASAVASANDAIVSPVIGTLPSQPSCIFNAGSPPGYAQQLAQATGGAAFQTSSSGLAQAVVNIAIAACQDFCAGGGGQPAGLHVLRPPARPIAVINPALANATD